MFIAATLKTKIESFDILILLCGVSTLQTKVMSVAISSYEHFCLRGFELLSIESWSIQLWHFELCYYKYIK